MTSDEFVPVGLQTPCSVGRGWLEGARAEPTKVRSRAGAFVSKCKVLDIGLTSVTPAGAELGTWAKLWMSKAGRVEQSRG